jgi:hypothetical protein
MLHSGNIDRVRLIKHKAVPDCGSYELRFPDGRPSKYFYFDNLPGRRLRSDVVDRSVATRVGEYKRRPKEANRRHRSWSLSYSSIKRSTRLCHALGSAGTGRSRKSRTRSNHPVLA